MAKICFVLAVAFLALCVNSSVVEEDDAVSSEGFSAEDSSSSEESQTNDTSPKDLYVIRKVVYEIGILTDASNSSDYDNKTHEQIDVSFFDPEDNGTVVDLSNIPFPVETNVSGVALTGIVTSNFGSLIFPDNETQGSFNQSSLPLLFPDKQIRVTKNISTVGKEQGDNLLSGLTQVLGLSKLVTSQQQTTTEKLP